MRKCLALFTVVFLAFLAAAHARTNQPPVADAGPDQAISALASEVQLNGAQSFDPDGDPITYMWSFVSKPAGSTATLSGANTVSASFVADVAGAYVVSLVVNDGTSESLPDTTTIIAGLVVNRFNRQEVKTFFNAIFKTAFDTSVGWTGSTLGCDPGDVSPDFYADTLQLVNFYRAMAGFPGEVIFGAVKNEKCQEGALMMQANGRLDHSGWTPSDQCYTADGAEALLKSLLSAGGVGPQGVELMMKDSISVYLGHRRLILYPPQTEMAMGATSNYFALWTLGAYGARPPSPEWVAWPPPGYVPYQIVYKAWSFSAPGAGFYGANVTVTKNGQAVPTTQTLLQPGYGDNTIGWEFMGGLAPNGPGMPDTTYTVTISNITGLSQSSYTYDVTIFDPASAKDDLVGTWDGKGVYYRNSDTKAWVKLAAPADRIAVGDLDGDGIDDLIGIWPGQGGVWVRHSKTASWSKLSSTASYIATGDMNGDGRVDLLGTWDGQGVFYKDSVGGGWVKLASPATLIAAGNLDGDGADDLIGIWPSQGGVWVKYSKTATWSRLSSAASDIAAGDMNSDGRDDFLGTWDGQGVFYKDSVGGGWVKLASPAMLIATGDLNEDNTDDLIGIWPTQGGVWVKYSKLGNWSYLSATARDITAGKMRSGGGGGVERLGEMIALQEPCGGLVEGPETLSGFKDRSDEGPGGWRFAWRVEINLVPGEGGFVVQTTPGPGDEGFAWVEQKNLVPREKMDIKQTKGNNKKIGRR